MLFRSWLDRSSAIVQCWQQDEQRYCPHRRRPASWSTDSLPSCVCLWQDSRCRRSSWPVLSLRFRSTLAPQPNQRRAPPSLHQVRFIGDARTTFIVHRQWQTTGWSDTGSLVTWSLPSMGCDLPRHVRRIARSGQQYTCWISGSSSRSAEISEVYADIITGVDFVPVAIETSGTWGEQAIDLVKEIGRRIAEATHEPRSTAFLRQRLSIAVQRGNAFCILGTFRGTDSVVSVGD